MQFISFLCLLYKKAGFDPIFEKGLLVNKADLEMWNPNFNMYQVF